jgi:hypothetical protein
MKRTAKMVGKRESKPDDPEQSKRFLEAARQAEADESEEAAERAFKRIVERPAKQANK